MDERQQNEGIPELMEEDHRSVQDVANDEGMDDEEWENEDDEESSDSQR